MKTIIFIICVLVATLDGFSALYSASKRVTKELHKIEWFKKSPIQVSLGFIDILDSDRMMGMLRTLTVHKAVCNHSGYTGRGNPLLSRNRYMNMENINNRIERIIQ